MMGTDLKVNRLVFDVQFFSVTIYKVGKCMMPSVFNLLRTVTLCIPAFKQPAQAHWKYVPVATFLQSYISLLIALFVTLSLCVFVFPKHESGNILLCWLL